MDRLVSQPLQVARCTKIINADSDDPKYIINVKQFAKFVVDLGDQVAPTDIEEGMRVGVDRNKYQIHIPLPPKIDPTVTMMQVITFLGIVAHRRCSLSTFLAFPLLPLSLSHSHISRSRKSPT